MTEQKPILRRLDTKLKKPTIFLSDCFKECAFTLPFFFIVMFLFTSNLRQYFHMSYTLGVLTPIIVVIDKRRSGY